MTTDLTTMADVLVVGGGPAGLAGRPAGGPRGSSIATGVSNGTGMLAKNAKRSARRATCIDRLVRPLSTSGIGPIRRWRVR